MVTIEMSFYATNLPVMKMKLIINEETVFKTLLLVRFGDIQDGRKEIKYSSNDSFLNDNPFKSHITSYGHI